MADGARVPLGRRALDIVSVLAEAGGGIVTKDELFAAVWPGVIVEENALQVHIAALRKALGEEANRLKTIRGVGYQLDVADDFSVEIARADQPQTADLSHWKGKVSAPEISDDLVPASTRGRPNLPRARAKPLHIAGIAIAGLALLGVLYLAFGDRAGSGFSVTQPHDRIPVLVRPFAASGSGDGNEMTLAGGITDELIVRLRRIPNLQVGSAGRDGAVGSGAFAGAYVVDGNIRSIDDQLRVTARLTKADGEILWTDTFDRKIGQLFELQETIAASIANALSVSLDVGTDSVAYGGTNNPEAYAAYMQFKINEFAFDQSVPLAFLKHAIALDPKYLKALSALSDSYSPRISYASTRAEADELLTEMDASTQRMLAANPGMWMGHVSRAWYYIARKNFTAARKEMDLAQRSGAQTDPELPGKLATLDYCLGYIKEASALVQSAEIIDPIFKNDPRVIRDFVYTGKYQEAIDLFHKLAQDGNAGRLNHTLEVFWAHMLLGREGEAIDFADKQGSDYGKEAMAIKVDKALPAMSLPELRQWVASKYGEGGHFQLANTAALASYYGHPDLAVNLMRLTLERPGAVGALTMWHPAFANARKTPAFAKLAQDEGFVKLWRATGVWNDFCHPTSKTGFACT
jgi:DNA-binding winged helix-turn-helix (wHTH) protein/TolB-like protein